MAPNSTKNKYKSQCIQKQFKNKRHDNFDAEWTHSSNSLHSRSFVNFCNEYHKNYGNVGHSEILEGNEAKYWRCNVCTFDNKECDLYCFICKSPFKSSSKSSLYHDITLNDYIPSDLNDNIHFEDDIDQSVQIAIILSIEEHKETQIICDQLQYDINYEYKYNKKYKNIKTQTLVPLTEQQKELRRKLKFEDRQKRIQENEKRESKQREKKRKRLQKLLEQKKKKEELRRERERLRQKQIIEQSLKQYPNIKTFVFRNNFEHNIETSISKTYSTKNKIFDMKLILNRRILSKFGSSSSDYKVVYHGTDNKNNKSIISNGLIIGGTHGVPRVHGAAYGKGIYCSPETSTASGYEKGSMFICIVKHGKVKRNGNIWVVPDDRDILPIYLATFKNSYVPPPPPPRPKRVIRKRPSKPYPTMARSVVSKKVSTSIIQPKDDLCQQIIKFIPSFQSLNIKKSLNRKIQRKWSAYYKINEYA